MRRVFIRLFLAVFLLSSVFFNVASAEPAASAASVPQTITGIDIKQVSLNPLKLNITINPQSADLLYQVWGQDANGWTLVSPYSDKYNVDWNPAVKKDEVYKVQVRIKDKATDEFLDQRTEMITVHDPSVLRIEKIIADTEIDGQGTVGKNINVEVIARGGQDIRYSFLVKQGNKWVARQTFTKSNLFVWKPTAVGTFTLRVDIFDANDITGTQADRMDKTFEIRAEGYIYPELKKMDIEMIGKTSNRRIVTESVQRGSYKNNYMFTIGEQYRKPTITESFKSNDKLVWNAPKSGIYEVSAYIKDSTSVKFDDAFRKIDYKVETSDVPKGISLATLELSKKDKTQAIGTQLEITAHGSGSKNLLYAFYKYEAKGYVVLQDYSPINTLKWKPMLPGEYTILARVKDVNSGSYEAQRSVTYSIIDPNKPVKASINSVDIAGDKKVGKALKITANASGTNSLMYEFGLRYDNYDWITLQSFSPDNTFYWLPKQARQYEIIVKVKDISSGSHLSSYTQKITVTK